MGQIIFPMGFIRGKLDTEVLVELLKVFWRIVSGVLTALITKMVIDKLIKKDFASTTVKFT